MIEELRLRGVERVRPERAAEEILAWLRGRTRGLEGRMHPFAPAWSGDHRRRRSARSMSRCASFLAMSCRLSAFLRPSATPISNFARPSLK